MHRSCGSVLSNVLVPLILVVHTCRPCSQGPDTTATREISTTVPVEQVPYIMRAIGFYPSEQEVRVQGWLEARTLVMVKYNQLVRIVWRVLRIGVCVIVRTRLRGFIGNTRSNIE